MRILILELGWKGLNHLCHSVQYIPYSCSLELHVFVLQNLTFWLLYILMSFFCTFFLVYFVKLHAVLYLTMAPLNQTSRSQELRKWSPTKDCWTNSPYQHLRKSIENSMENIQPCTQKLSKKSCYDLELVLKVAHWTLSRGTLEHWHCAWVFADHIITNCLCILSVHEIFLCSLHCCWFVWKSFFQIIPCKLASLLVSFCCYLISSF